MKKHTWTLLIIITHLNISCKDRNNLNGYWIGKVHMSDFNSEILMKFDNGYCRFSSHMEESFAYKTIGNKIKLYPIEFGNKFALTFQIINDSLYLYHSKADTLLYSLKRIKSNNLIKREIKRSKLEINLPTGYSHKTSVFEIPNEKQYFIYLGRSSDSLFVNFNETIYPLNENLHQIIRNNFQYDFDYQRQKVNLFIDKNVKYVDYYILEQQLSCSGLTNTRIIFGSSVNDSINFLQKKLPPCTNTQVYNIADSFHIFSNPPLPPPPPPSIYDAEPEFLKKSTIVEIKSDSISFRNFAGANLTPEEITKKIKSKDIMSIFYVYSHKNMTYGDYIKAMSTIYQIIDDIRDEYSVVNYGLEFSQLNKGVRDEIEDLYNFGIGVIDQKKLDAFNTTYNNI